MGAYSELPGTRWGLSALQGSEPIQFRPCFRSPRISSRPLPTTHRLGLRLRIGKERTMSDSLYASLLTSRGSKSGFIVILIASLSINLKTDEEVGRTATKEELQQNDPQRQVLKARNQECSEIKGKPYSTRKPVRRRNSTSRPSIFSLDSFEFGGHCHRNGVLPDEAPK